MSLVRFTSVSLSLAAFASSAKGAIKVYFEVAGD